VKIRPANPGMMIRDPNTRRPLPEDGARVSVSNFWRRRLADGDVVIVETEEGEDADDLEGRVPEVEGAPVQPEHGDVPPLATRERGGFFSRRKGEETR
jgi:hypothetical protein